MWHLINIQHWFKIITSAHLSEWGMTGVLWSHQKILHHYCNQNAAFQRCWVPLVHSLSCSLQKHEQYKTLKLCPSTLQRVVKITLTAALRDSPLCRCSSLVSSLESYRRGSLKLTVTSFLRSFIILGLELWWHLRRWRSSGWSLLKLEWKKW